MPMGATVVRVAEQHGTICIWACVDPERVSVWRRFVAIATAEPVGSELIYCGTALCAQGETVWHVFEVPCDG